MNIEKEISFSYYFKKGLEEQNKKEYSKAIYYYKKSIECNKTLKNYNSYLNIAKCYIQTKIYQIAIKYLESAIKINPDEQIAYIEIGNTYFIKSDYYHAMLYYHKALQLENNEIIQDKLFYAKKLIEYMSSNN